MCFVSVVILFHQFSILVGQYKYTKLEGMGTFFHSYIVTIIPSELSPEISYDPF